MGKDEATVGIGERLEQRAVDREARALEVGAGRDVEDAPLNGAGGDCGGADRGQQEASNDES